ncbi:helix-turn-helix domain-containing protein [Salmonella enterica]|uniref:LexA family protein n=1 Tax=Salmonella enterica TaxID=28901 RepID=UPI0012753A0A|nr:helix-turn-helix domain-containing protein [Salmonella enterica]EDK3863760.1 XRE family transcriptional regulator [Salmonella enterica subsp. enterica serovar Muenchen]EBG2093980.1 helix-turn-helix domain-containing protein [Salmonella enterica]EBL6728532.1 helix-turn-helix domain-containing protein [Salmonella enterica]ECX4905340.1 helix-turn-helix domain-containing protein [Salmonella enterica]
METVGQRIKHLREKLKLSQAELAAKCGWDYQSRVGNYETGARKVSVEDAVILSSILNVTPGELLFGTPDNAEFITPGLRPVPLVSYVQAGMFTAPDYLMPPGDVEEFIHIDSPASPLVFALKVKGDSMEPEFREGDTIIVDPEVYPHPGEFVVAKNGDHEATFKKFREKPAGGFELVPLNPDYAVLDSDKHNITIIGTMIEHRIHRRKR